MANGVDPSTTATIARIRKLLAQGYGVNEIARRVNRSHSNVSNIKNGRRHAHTGALTIDSLGLRRTENEKKLCRRCGNPANGLVTMSGVCIVCEMNELCRQGLIRIEEFNHDS